MRGVNIQNITIKGSDNYMKDINKCCGTCKYHEHENVDDGWVCVNQDSEYVADWTDYDHCCEEYEER